MDVKKTGWWNCSILIFETNKLLTLISLIYLENLKLENSIATRHLRSFQSHIN